MPSYYYPERTYHQLNAVAYPDHSRELPGALGVLRAMWRKGEQMWDEDFNNSLEWVGWWNTLHVFNRWWEPRYPWYSPQVSRYLVEPDHNMDIEGVNNAVVIDFTNPTSFDFFFPPWPGVTVIALADRQFVGYRRSPGAPDEVEAGGYQGLAQFQEYNDEIEIAFFFSETRKNRILGAHTVVEPFRLHQKSYSSRVRGWPVAGFNSGSLLILKNGVQVGIAWKAEFSSGISLTATTEFAAGDVLAIKQSNDGGVRYGVTVSIVGELL